MNIETLKHFCQDEENHYFDRKSARIKPADAARHVVAFANAAGGDLVIGIENDGTISGFKQEKAYSVEDFEQIHITLCEPSPDVRSERVPVVNSNGQSDVALILHVKPLENRIVRRRTDGRVYQRQGDSSPVLDYEQTRALEYDKGQTYFENELETRSSLDDVDHDFNI